MNKLVFAHKMVLKPLLHNLQGYNDKEHLLQIQEYEIKLEKNIEQRQVLASLMSSGLLEHALFNKENNALILEEQRLREEKDKTVYSVSGDRTKVKEEELQNAVVKAINQTIGDRDEMFDILEENIKMVFALEDESSLEGINARLEETQRELLKRANAKQNYNDLADELDHLREMKQAALTENAEREGLKQRIAEMKLNTLPEQSA